MTVHLLPPNSTPQEQALEHATNRLSAVPVPLRDLWNANTCPARLLAWLAWSYGVDEWQEDWPELFKRETIRQAIGVQRRKGTVGSIKRVLNSAGYPSAILSEGNPRRTYDGSVTHDGFQHYGWGKQFAKYRAKLEKPITSAQGQQVRRLLDTTAPARCYLFSLDFTEAANLYNSAIRYDGAFTYGTV